MQLETRKTSIKNKINTFLFMDQDAFKNENFSNGKNNFNIIQKSRCLFNFLETDEEMLKINLIL